MTGSQTATREDQPSRLLQTTRETIYCQGHSQLPWAQIATMWTASYQRHCQLSGNTDSYQEQPTVRKPAAIRSTASCQETQTATRNSQPSGNQLLSGAQQAVREHRQLPGTANCQETSCYPEHSQLSGNTDSYQEQPSVRKPAAIRSTASCQGHV